MTVTRIGARRFLLGLALSASLALSAATPSLAAVTATWTDA